MRFTMSKTKNWVRTVIPALAPCLLLVAHHRVAAADFESELREAVATVQVQLEPIQELVNEGQVSEANQRLLAVFPKEKRTPAQTMALGNLLYGIDTNLSYALHQEVARQLPTEPLVLMEWAMEQHRAGEYAGALAAYDAYSKQHPQYAPVHGLASDCLIRLGRIPEAAARWQKSEEARSGTLVQLESLVCEIYKDHSLQLRRAVLRSKTVKGDVEAAVQLIVLDGKFEFDWWNVGPHLTYLDQDRALLNKLAPGPRVKAAQCVVECLLLEDAEPNQMRSVLERHGLLVDPAKTLPSDPVLLSLLLGIAIRAEVLSAAEARLQFGEKILAEAVRTKNAELFNVVAFLSSGTDRMGELELQAWEATGQARFAAGYLVEQLSNKALQRSDPLLLKAMKQFPEDALIMYVATQLNDPPSEAMLVQAIKAEFRRFSAVLGIIPRPSAKLLRIYFSKLAKSMQQPTPKIRQEARALIQH